MACLVSWVLPHIRSSSLAMWCGLPIDDAPWQEAFSWSAEADMTLMALK